MSVKGDEATAFTCNASGLRHRHAAGSAERPNGAVTVDVHCHVHIDSADQIAISERRRGHEPILDFTSPETVAQNRASLGAVRGKLHNLDSRLQDMDSLGIDLQVISPSPFQYFYWVDPDIGRETSRIVNDWIAEQVAHNSKRFAGLCTVPLQNTDLAIEELERALSIGLKGVEIGTNVGDDELSAERLRPFFARAEELGTFIFIHPNGFTHGSRLARHNLINLIGNPLETTVAASQLIFGGVMKDMPGLKICLAHGGGYLPMYSGRMDHAFGERPDCRSCISELPSSYLRQFYFDSVVYEQSQLEYLVKAYGADRVLMGTDYPYDMGEPDPVGFISGIQSLSDAEKRKIIGENTVSLLGLDVDAFKTVA